MTHFSIEYNPYLVKYVFKMNGKELNEKNNRIGGKADRRLQVLLGKTSNWNGLLYEIASACDDDAVEIHFKGRKIDFEDIEYALALYDGNVKFSLSFTETKNDANIIQELDQIFKEIKEKNIPEFRVQNSDGQDIFDAYEEVKNGIFKVSVIATMSSGKSTLINALLHTDLLPAENKACTATIVRIFDNDGMEKYEAECYGTDEKTVIHPRATVNAALLKKYNKEETIEYIDIYGNIPSVSSNKISLCLQDTPGPNNSRNDNHERLTRAIIRETDAVILYVMNATQFGIDDDKELLKDISSIMNREAKKSQDRFIFIINQCDKMDEEKGETVDKLLDDAREYLKQFGITEPTLIPTSARLALLIRKARKGEKLSRAEKQDLGMYSDFVETKLLHYEKYAVLTPNVREKLQKEVEKYHQDEETWDLEALVHTGIRAVEETICEYIDKYAYPIKINDAVRDVIGILGELNMKDKFAASICEDDEKLKSVREQILEAQKKNRDSESIYNEYKNIINGFGLDPADKRKALKAFEREGERIFKDYSNKTKVDTIIAINLIAEFQRRLEKFQKEYESGLNRRIEEEVFQKGNELLDKYSKMVCQALGNIRVDGYDFKKLRVFDRIRISDIDNIKRKYEKIRYKEKVCSKDNPKREGFWGRFKFWEPEKISYTTQVVDGVDVNVKKVILDIMMEFSRQMGENIDVVFASAEAQVGDYKKTFEENIDTLKEEITKILHELDSYTEQFNTLEKQIEINAELSRWEEEQENKIKRILSF